MKIYLIRHGKTAGNILRRYIGVTDEPLCEAGISELRGKRYPDCSLVISSPMKRCIESARIIYPSRELVTCAELSECNFGDFEGKNYRELSGNADYQRWIDSGGALPFPNGEAPGEFKARVVRGFDEMIGRYSGREAIAFVVHGGVIMAILERYAVPRRGFYDYRVDNGGGFAAVFDVDSREIREVRKL